MKLTTPVPAPVTWILRIAGWSVGLLLIWAAFAFYASMRLGKHVEACFDRPAARGAMTQGSAFPTAQAFVACLEREAGWIEQAVLYFQKQPITSPEAVPCKYVGEWKATRPPNVVYDITLNADRSFVALPVIPRDAERMSGVWLVHGNRIAWLYDSMPMWPPDSNPVRDPSETGFSLIERDGSATRYELVRRTASTACVA